jgi:hypothetical protein
MSEFIHACNKHRQQNNTHVSLKTTKKSGKSGDLGVDGKMISRWILKKTRDEEED